MDIWESSLGLEKNGSFVPIMAIYNNRVAFLGYKITGSVLTRTELITLLFKNIKNVRKVNSGIVGRIFPKMADRAIIFETYDNTSYRADFLGESMVNDWNEAYRLLMERL